MKNIALALALICPLTASAQPLVNDDTLLVVHAPVNRLNAKSLLKIAETGKAISPTERIAFAAMADDILADLKKAGVREIHHAYGFSDIPSEAGHAVLIGDNAFDADALKLIRSRLGGTRFTVHVMKPNQLVVGVKPEAAAKQASNVDQPEFTRALEAVKEFDVRIAIRVPALVRKSLRELAPRLVDAAGNNRFDAVFNGFEWLAIGVNLDAKATVHAIVQTKDADAAKIMHGLFLEAIPSIRKAAEADLSPEFFDRLGSPKVEDRRIVWTLDPADLLGLVGVERAKRIGNDHDRLRQIGLALHSYHDAQKTFPAQANFDKAGKPLLSWRVHILPYLDQVGLYKQFKLDEPWDSEHNKTLIAKVPDFYTGVRVKPEAGKTCFLAPISKSTIIGPKASRMRDITDGTANTIIVLEVKPERAVVWTKPEDYAVDEKTPAQGLPDGRFLALFADGSTRSLRRNIDAALLNALFTKDGGEPIEIPD